MEGFSLDTTVFTEQELTAIFTGLKSLDSVSRSASAEKLAIRETQCIAFHYCYNKGEADKLIEPYLIVFKQFGSHMTDDYIIPAVYDSSVKYRLVDEYGHTCFTEQEDGKLYTEWGLTTQKDAME